jgi:CHAT domain-containing protein
VDEAREVAALLEGAEVLIGESLGRDAVLNALCKADFIHISAYGFFSEDEPGRSGLLLRSTEDVMRFLAARAKKSHEQTPSDLLLATDEVLPREAIVTVADVERLHLRARLVTLSACESGLVRTDEADDPAGLVPALLASGVPAVVATLWQVDPEATEQFMVALYRHLTQSDLDWSRKPHALRLAVLDLMRTRQHPYYWAPFILIGGGVPGAAEPRETYCLRME